MNPPSLVRRLLHVWLAGFALVLAAVAVPVAMAALTPAQAQVSGEFQAALDSYGAWVRHPRWGEVWVPDDVGSGWRPYTRGRWIYTDEWGWYWVSDEAEEDWGWVTYHYGRWAHDRRLGWFWIPGDEWAPAWVDWRRGDDYVGWAPLPPDEVIYVYDEDPAYWVFMRLRYLLAPQPHRYYLPYNRSRSVLLNTVVINRTIGVQHLRNGHSRVAVNAGVSPAVVAAARRSPVPAFRVNPQVLAGTSGVAGAVAIRPQDLSRRQPGQRNRALAPRIQRTNVTVRPATTVGKPQPLGKNERGRLGTHPPRAAQGAVIAPTTTPTVVAPQQRKAPPSAAPQTGRPSSPQIKQSQPAAPQPRQGAPQAKPQRPVTPPPSRVKPPPKQPGTPPSPAKPQRPTPPKASPPAQIKRQQPAKPRPAHQPTVRPAPRPPAVHQPPQVRKPPPPAQVHRPPPVRKPAPAPAQARKPPPKKPAGKGEKEKKR